MNGPMPWKPECNPIRWIPGCDNPYQNRSCPHIRNGFWQRLLCFQLDCYESPRSFWSGFNPHKAGECLQHLSRMGSQCKGPLQIYRVQSESLQSHLVPLAFPLLTIIVFFPTLQIKGPQIKTCFCPTHESARLQYFPVLGGQGHDCVVLCKWLSVFLAGTSTTDMVTGSKFGIFLGMGLYNCFLFYFRGQVSTYSPISSRTRAAR